MTGYLQRAEFKNTTKTSVKTKLYDRLDWGDCSSGGRADRKAGGSIPGFTTNPNASIGVWMLESTTPSPVSWTPLWFNQLKQVDHFIHELSEPATREPTGRVPPLVKYLHLHSKWWTIVISAKTAFRKVKQYQIVHTHVCILSVYTEIHITDTCRRRATSMYNNILNIHKNLLLVEPVITASDTSSFWINKLWRPHACRGTNHSCASTAATASLFCQAGTEI